MHHQSVLPKFQPANVVVTPGALDALTRANEPPESMLARHISADWGDVGQVDWDTNNAALANGGTLYSHFKTGLGEEIMVVTVWDRSVTTILLVDEY